MNLPSCLSIRGAGRALWLDDRGFVLSAEVALILTIGVLAMVVGVHAVAKAINTELSDVAGAFGSLSQSYTVRGFAVWCPVWGVNAATSGSGFWDRGDECDCAGVITTNGYYGGQGYAAGSGGSVVAPGAASGVVPGAAVTPCGPDAVCPPQCPSGDCPPLDCPAGDCPAGALAAPGQPAPHAEPAPSKKHGAEGR